MSPCQLYEVKEVAHFEPLEIKAEPEDEGGNQFRLNFPEKDNLSLRIKTAHKLEFSVKAITKKIDLVLRRATFPLTPIEVLDRAGHLVSPFTISGHTVKHGPIAVRDAAGNVIHQGATVEVENTNYLMISFIQASTMLTRNERTQGLQVKPAKQQELLLIDHNSGQILDTLEVRIFIEPRSKDYYKKYYRKAAPKRKHDEGKEEDEEKEEEEEKEEDEEKEHICKEIINLFQEHGKMMHLEDLKAVFRITKRIMRQ